MQQNYTPYSVPPMGSHWATEPNNAYQQGLVYNIPMQGPPLPMALNHALQAAPLAAFRAANTASPNASPNGKLRTTLPHNWDQKCDLCHRHADIRTCNSNTNGNEGKEYGLCVPCNRWLGFLPTSRTPHQPKTAHHKITYPTSCSHSRSHSRSLSPIAKHNSSGRGRNKERRGEKRQGQHKRQHRPRSNSHSRHSHSHSRHSRSCSHSHSHSRSRSRSQSPRHTSHRHSQSPQSGSRYRSPPHTRHRGRSRSPQREVRYKLSSKDLKEGKTAACASDKYHKQNTHTTDNSNNIDITKPHHTN